MKTIYAREKETEGGRRDTNVNGESGEREGVGLARKLPRPFFS